MLVLLDPQKMLGVGREGEEGLPARGVPGDDLVALGNDPVLAGLVVDRILRPSVRCILQQRLQRGDIPADRFVTDQRMDIATGQVSPDEHVVGLAHIPRARIREHVTVVDGVVLHIPTTCSIL